MQTLAGALLSLRGTWGSTGRGAVRAISDAASKWEKHEGRQASQAAEREGAKSLLFKILGASAEPLTSEKVWEQAQEVGLKSKRFTKQMLQQLRVAGWVKTQPLHAGSSSGGGKKQRIHGYRLNPKKQEERDAKLFGSASVESGTQQARPNAAAAGPN